MANAKQYSELDAATSVSSEDLFAVSQAGAPELKKATVAQVAEPIADVLSTGALAELEYATSQGKNAVATALTNKGVTTTPSETLIQMADKINNLNIDTSKENLVGPAVVATASSSYANAFSGHGVVFDASTISGLIAVYAAPVLKIFKLKSYDSLTDFWDNPLATISDLPASTYVKLSFSPDGTKLFLGQSPSRSNMIYKIYDVSTVSATNAVQELYANTSPVNYGTSIFYPTNDGEYFTALGSNYIYVVKSSDATYTRITTTPSGDSSNYSTYWSVIVGTSLYLCWAYTRSTPYAYHIDKYSISENAEGVRTYTLVASRDLPTSLYPVFTSSDTLYLIGATDATSEFTSSIVEHTTYITTWDNLEQSNPIVGYKSYEALYGSTAHLLSTQPYQDPTSIVVSENGSSITCSAWYLHNPITYTKESNSFTTKEANIAYKNGTGSGSYASNSVWLTLSDGTLVNTARGSSGGRWTCYNATSTTLYAYPIYKNQLLVLKKTMPTEFEYYAVGPLTDNNIKSGNLTANTQITPAIPDTND